MIVTEFTKKLLANFSTNEIIGKSIKDKRGGKNNIHSWDIDLKGKTSKDERILLNLLLKERRKKHQEGIKGKKEIMNLESFYKTAKWVNLRNII